MKYIILPLYALLVALLVVLDLAVAAPVAGLVYVVTTASREARWRLFLGYLQGTADTELEWAAEEFELIRRALCTRGGRGER